VRYKYMDQKFNRPWQKLERGFRLNQTSYTAIDWNKKSCEIHKSSKVIAEGIVELRAFNQSSSLSSCGGYVGRFAPPRNCT